MSGPVLTGIVFAPNGTFAELDDGTTRRWEPAVIPGPAHLEVPKTAPKAAELTFAAKAVKLQSSGIGDPTPTTGEPA